MYVRALVVLDVGGARPGNGLLALRVRHHIIVGRALSSAERTRVVDGVVHAVGKGLHIDVLALSTKLVIGESGHEQRRRGKHGGDEGLDRHDS